MDASSTKHGCWEVNTILKGILQDLGSLDSYIPFLLEAFSFLDKAWTHFI